MSLQVDLVPRVHAAQVLTRPDWSWKSVQLWSWELSWVCCWCLTSLEYVYFEGYITDRYFMLKRWADIVGQDYCYINSKNSQDFGRWWHYMYKAGVKYGLGSRPTKMDRFLKGWTYLYIFSWQIFIIYIYLLKSIFFTGIWR